ncbi:MAG: rhomboid family intramembrane serine protease [Candidatus Micrarchaeota archaeon]
MPFREMSYAMMLLYINLFAFVIQFFLPLPLLQMLMLDPKNALFMPWQFVTSMFMHAGLFHLFFNMFALLIFGPLLEQRIGGRQFLILYFLAGLAGGVLYILTGGTVPALGASGAIFGILGAMAALEPNMIIFVGFIPMPMWLAGIFWLFTEIVSGVAAVTNIANFAHVGGLAIGYVYAKRAKPDMVLLG